MIASHAGAARTRRSLCGAGIVLAASSMSLFAQRASGKTRVGFLGGRAGLADPVTRRTIDPLLQGLRERGWVEGQNLIAVEARGRSDFEAAFAAMAHEGAHALVVLPDPVFFTARKQVVEWATTYRLPAIYHAREIVEMGGLMSYGANLADQFRRAAGYVDRILKGANPAEMPVEQPTRFEQVINLKTAKALGITISQSLLLRAHEVIE